MADRTHIEWTDATWNPVTGCSVASPGCANCYAMRLAGGRLRHHPSRAGLTQPSKAGPVWTGEVRFNEAELLKPLRWRRPRKIFVCAHGDLFHENVPDAWIDRVFAVMALCPQFDFQVLTKRAARMRAYLSDPLRHNAIELAAETIRHGRPEMGGKHILPELPLPNVWLGVSTEDQPTADERIPELLAAPAAVRFISAEPLLGEIDLSNPYTSELFDKLAYERRLELTSPWQDSVGGWHDDNSGEGLLPGLDWVIVGGESGPHARDMDEAWARDIQAQCAAAGVAFFMKQMARKAPIPADLLVRQWPGEAAHD